MQATKNNCNDANRYFFSFYRDSLDHFHSESVKIMHRWFVVIVKSYILIIFDLPKYSMIRNHQVSKVAHSFFKNRQNVSFEVIFFLNQTEKN